MTTEKTEIEKLDLKSLSVTEEKQSELLRLFPEIRTEGGKIDFEKLKYSLGATIDTGKERYSLTWPGKVNCFKTIQESSMGTLRPCVNDSLNFDKSENLIIEGDNLEILKLLQKAYLGKVKLIYIDPPYNTGNDFIYPDNYSESLQTYLEYSGQVDAEGRKFGTNTESDGRFHSKWLNMMYSRLYLARNLLTEDGVIFISIDDNEAHNLRKICDEIFGEESFVSTIVWEKRYSPQNAVQWFSEAHDFILVYAKNKESWRPNLLGRSDEMNARYRNLDNDPRGDWKPSDATAQAGHGTASQFYEFVAPNGNRFQPPNGRCWVYTKDRIEEMIADKRVWFGADGNSAPAIKRFLTEVKQGVACQTIWKYDDVGHNQEGKKEIKILFPESVPFDTPKPTRLLRRILELSTDKDENQIVLDFFAGSGTAAQAVMEQNFSDAGNRKFILVQLPEKTEDKDFSTIAEITKERVRRVIKRLAEENNQTSMIDRKEIDLGFKAFKLSESNFKAWRQDTASNDGLAAQLELHVDHVKHERTADDILYEILLKSGFPLTTKIEVQKVGKQSVYSIASGMLLVCLENDLNLNLIKHIAEQKPERVICLDQGFANNDQLKANAVQIFRTKGIASFKTV